ncbi:MAG: mitochondrial fission ELM1 family protein [Proteobacteria bacterium]|nr:mitochondrial fission ELM1 family protein [Pseudomonadota bacterium]
MGERIWVVTDGRAGNERQALALARALGGVTESSASTMLSSDTALRVWRLRAFAPWQQAAPRRLPGSERAFGDEFRLALNAPPRLAIGCGRQGALATRLLREAGARVVQILDPRIDPRHWDAVIVPEHDRLRGANVITLLGSLHEVDAHWLQAARLQHPAIGELPAPRTVLLLGGPIRNVPLDARWWRRTAEALRRLHAREGGSVSVCASRRTPAWLIASVRKDLADLPGLRWLDARDGENPYPGLLGWAQRLVVSPDSVNMLSEAAATGADVRIAGAEIARGRHAAFIASLIARGCAQDFDAQAPLTPATVLQELPRVAVILRGRLGVS